MIELEVISGFLGGGTLIGFCVYIYLQKKISHIAQEMTLYQERARRSDELEALLLKREEELRLQGKGMPSSESPFSGRKRKATINFPF